MPGDAWPPWGALTVQKAVCTSRKAGLTVQKALCTSRKAGQTVQRTLCTSRETRLTVQRVLCTSGVTGLTVQRFWWWRGPGQRGEPQKLVANSLKCQLASKVGTQFIYFDWPEKRWGPIYV